GVVHRDPKPANILIDASGEGVVTDWGLARIVTDPEEGPGPGLHVSEWAGPSITRTGAVLGTPAYMSPEAAPGERTDFRSDVFGLGTSLFHLLTGRPPISGPSPSDTLYLVATGRFPRAREVSPAVPPALDAICSRAMAPDPARRYARVDELIADVEAW